MTSKLTKKVFDMFFAISLAISLVSISTIILLNSTWIYNIAINYFQLENKTGVLKENIIKDYEGLINYLQNPFIEKLKFENFVMSINGEIHFEEVKNIFIVLIIISIISIMILLGYLIYKRIKSENLESLLIIFNKASNLLIGFFVFIGALYLIDFSWAFEMFHKIFFRNDYWIFDPKLDSIILALPEQYFMICGAIVIVILIIAVSIIKIINYLKKHEQV